MILSGNYLVWLIEGVKTSVSLIIISAAIAVVVGVLFAFLSLSKIRVLRFIASAYVELCRNIPTLIWIYFFFFAFPTLFPDDISSAINRNPYLAYVAAVAGLSLSSSGYISEIVRGGILAVPKEQTLASYSLGLSKMQIWWHVIWPQALRNCFPSLANRIIHNTQNTSLAMTISVHEVMWATSRIQSITFHGIETMLLATLFFVICCFTLEACAQLIEKRLLPAVS